MARAPREGMPADWSAAGKALAKIQIRFHRFGIQTALPSIYGLFSFTHY
jgi:hypothetical protein